jgi:hypothetical protein
MVPGSSASSPAISLSPMTVWRYRKKNMTTPTRASTRCVSTPLPE